MAEEGEDRSQKTEDPTQRKLDEARRKGRVPSSREVNHWFMILAATLVVGFMAPTIMGELGRSLSGFLGQAHAWRVDGAALHQLGARAFADSVLALLPALALLVGAALAAGLVQHGAVVAPERIRPKLENISLAKGLGRLFSARSLLEFVKGVLKLAIVGTVATLLIIPAMDRIGAASAMAPAAILDLLWSLATRMLAGVCAVVTIIAGLDFLYQRFEFFRSMRMSRQEIKDELKQSEGDPQVKARLRQLRQERARKRMMAAVPEADVVISNPEHVAVALKYDAAVMQAPKVVAKGVDAVALRMRRVAEDNDVVVVENPPLARALWDGVDLDQEIPETHYKAVTEVIGYVWRLKGKMPPRRGG